MARRSAKTALIIGLPGVGKSTLTQELENMGRQAIDTDTIKGLGRWSCLPGHSCRPYQPNKPPSLDELTLDVVRKAFGSFEVPYQPDKNWRDRHTYKWGIDKMQRTIDTRDRRKPLYIVGTAANASALFGMFDARVILTVSPTTLAERLHLRAQDKTAPFPFTYDEETAAAFKLSAFIDESLSDATLVSAESRPTRVARSVIELVES